MSITRLEKENVLAASLWGTNLGRDVASIAEDQLEELEKLGYTLVKKRTTT